MAAVTQTCAAVAVLCLALSITAAALSPNEARRKQLMMLDPRMPVKQQQRQHGDVELQQQQRLQQQVQRYATTGSKASGRSRISRHKRTRRSIVFERSSRPLARSLLGRLADVPAKGQQTNSRSSGSPNLPPPSCYHLEQQELHMLLDFDCSMPGVQGQSTTHLESKICAAALNQMQQYSMDITADFNYQDQTTTECHATRSCEASFSTGGNSMELTLSIALPYYTCAVVQQTLADAVTAHPQLLFRSDPQLAAAVGNATQIPTVDSRVTSVQAAIQSSRNEIYRAVSISAEDAASLLMYGGMDEEASDDPESQWLWDPSVDPYNLDLSSSIGIWIAAVCTFGVGMLMLALMLLHKGVLAIARARAEERLIQRARANAAAAAAEARGEASAADSDSDSEYDSSRADLLAPAAATAAATRQ